MKGDALHPVLIEILRQRGLSGDEAVERFLSPKLSDQHDPFLLLGMDEAVARVRRAAQTGEKVLVHGDYDADGITATALLFMLFMRLGIKCQVFLPQRENGYGLQSEALHLAKDNGCSLVVCVDCGITAVEPAWEAERLGLELIILDHHLPGETLPLAAAIVNPRLPSCSYPYKELAGVGVAYKLAQALLGEEAHRFLDLVAIGTVADVCSLTGENRALVYHGLKLLQTPSLGIAALMAVAGVEPSKLRAGHIAFALAPRLNAPGRLTDAELPLLLLLARDPLKARTQAEELDKLNRARQRLEQEVLEQALAQVDLSHQAMVLSAPHWPHGVVGIVAARLVEKFSRPALLLGRDEDGNWRGSGRSIEGFNLVEALGRCRAYLTKFGGHSMAAGLTLSDDQLTPFRDAFLNVADEMPQELLIPRLRIDAEVDAEDLSLVLATQLELLAPFGIGNPEPVLLSKKLTVTETRVVGKDSSHLRITWCTARGRTQNGVLFRGADKNHTIAVGDRIDLALRLGRDEFRGQEQLSIRIQEFRVGWEWWYCPSPLIADSRFKLIPPTLRMEFFQAPHVFTPFFLRRRGAEFELRQEFTPTAADHCSVVARHLGPWGAPPAACSFVEQDVMYNGREHLRWLNPSREDLAIVYRFIVAGASFSWEALARHLGVPLAVAYSVAALSLRIFHELDLLEYNVTPLGAECQTKSTAKRDLAASATFVALKNTPMEDDDYVTSGSRSR